MKGIGIEDGSSKGQRQPSSIDERNTIRSKNKSVKNKKISKKFGLRFNLISAMCKLELGKS